ncbi:putative siderophore transport system ATP-binding protein YusV [Gimesia alba]|uniref:Putative siderophore transport system ATP-binding protein YusV n=1 Tax=Gimesia alba TaxID=2527973 RepID=A0A517RAH4_9PLAN|nr:ABC transporter ATP-binding protein [Gimesia alba]QDT40879.1 putative siderophore transport system ATP-binding protein YusV [Gimesia alba]
MNQLELNQVSCGYADRDVLKQVSLCVEPGKVMVLLGPNGSGKTTLLRALFNLVDVKEGQALIEGQEIRRLSRKEIAQKLALSPQMELPQWPMTVEETVQLGRSSHRGWVQPFQSDDAAHVEQALQQTGLTELRQRKITELSGGEWRRTLIARALAQQTNVLCLDEPTTGLDLKYQVEILSLIRDLAHERDLTVMLTIHDLNLASCFADQFVLLHQGRIAAMGTGEEVLTEARLTEVYQTKVKVVPHPEYQTPLIVPVL